MLEVLRNRTYRRLFGAQIVALIGTGLLTVALGLLAFDLAGGDAGIVLGIALTIKMLAYVGIAPVISALTAHVPRKTLLVSADVLRAIVALSLPFVTEAWQIYVLIFVLQAASTGMVIVNTVVLVQSHFGRAQSDFAIALACYGFGSMLVALALPRLLDRFADRRVMLLGCTVLPIGLIALALVILAPATASTWSSLLVIWFIRGAATALILTPSARLLRRSSDASTRPPVFAAQFSLSHACFIVTYPLAGVLSALLGLAPTALVLAAIGIAAAVSAARVWTPSAPTRDTESPARET
ncbi:MFS transporter [Cryobacterium sp. Y11]|uniref:MFS transporter n=1 Tax=Cryobacterium sp. Y11 TaxID=2045016 RepID=UPI000CE57512|nr:MFS transporter [Cryobacterium sp. Y11]